MSRLATVTVILSLFASTSLAAPPQGGKPTTDAKPAKAQQRAGARKDAQKTPPVTTKQQTGAKKIGANGKEQGAKPGARADSAGTPAKQEAKPGARADSAGTPAKQGAKPGAKPGPKLDRQEMVHKLMLEERKHRERLAKIARLRALAEHKQQTERVAALDELLVKENARYARWMEEGKQTLGDKGFADVNGKLQHGRRTPGDRKATPNPAKKADTTEKTGTTEKGDTTEKAGTAEKGKAPAKKIEKDQAEKDGR